MNSATALDTIQDGSVDRRHQPRLRAWHDSLAFAWRALLKIKHVPEQLFEAVSIPLVFTLLFTYLFGGAMAGSTKEYLQFILPGTLAMAVLLVTMYTATAIHADVSRGVFDRFRTLAIWRPAPLVGLILGEAVRFLLASLIVVGLGLVMGYRPESVIGMVLAVGLVVLFGLSISWVWTVIGLIARSPNVVTGLATVVVFPLTMASNVFVDPDTMPGWLQTVVNLNPVTTLVDAERALINGAGATADLGWALAATALLTVVFAPLSIYLYQRRQ